MDDLQALQLHIEDRVARITLNRPAAKNALNRAMADELTAVATALARRDDVNVVLLHGAGGNFCSGGDVRGMQQAGPRSEAEIRAEMDRYSHMVKALQALPQPLVAAVEGVAYGAGLSLALLADLVLVAEGARLCVVFGRIGLIPDCGLLYTLPRAVGLQRAKELTLSAREFGAEEARALGLALEVLPPAQLLARAQALAASVARASPLASALSKDALQRSGQADLATMLDLEAQGQAQALGSAYHREAIRRFLAKEPPLLNGQVSGSAA